MKNIEDIREENMDYIDRATDIIYFNFKQFGWEWNKGVPSRSDIEETIMELLEDAIKYKEAESGRIRVSYYEDFLEIGLMI